LNLANGVKLICPNGISTVKREAKKSYKKQPNNIIKQELTTMPISQHPA
jgi:hypothetical protein